MNKIIKVGNRDIVVSLKEIMEWADRGELSTYVERLCEGIPEAFDVVMNAVFVMCLDEENRLLVIEEELSDMIAEIRIGLGKADKSALLVISRFLKKVGCMEDTKVVN